MNDLSRQVADEPDVGPSMNDTYSAYLQSAAWEQKRTQRLSLSGFSCEACGTRDRLQVHHLTYERIFKEEMSDLMTLCNLHHEAAEEMIRKGAIPRRGDVAAIARQTMEFIAPLKAKRRTSRPAPKREKPKRPVRRLTPYQQKKQAKRERLIDMPLEFRSLTRKTRPAVFQKLLQENAEFMAIVTLPRLKYRKLSRKMFGPSHIRGKILSNASKVRDLLVTFEERESPQIEGVAK